MALDRYDEALVLLNGPLLNTADQDAQIKFLRDGYGPGDTVTATLEAIRAEGGVPERAARVSDRAGDDRGGRDGAQSWRKPDADAVDAGR
jgi:hypothetical protein